MYVTNLTPGSECNPTSRQYTDMSVIGAQVPVPKVIGMKRVLSVDDNTERASITFNAEANGGASREGSKHGSSQAYHMLHRTPSYGDVHGGAVQVESQLVVTHR
jgi:hypothetical protein